MKTGINIGPEKETVLAARQAIIDILKSGQEQLTMQKALEVFGNICEVKYTTISGCNIGNGK